MGRIHTTPPRGYFSEARMESMSNARMQGTQEIELIDLLANTLITYDEKLKMHLAFKKFTAHRAALAISRLKEAIKERSAGNTWPAA